MIKKTTIATFRGGDYKGNYDWQGGIPLSVGETLEVTVRGNTLLYKLVNKTTSLTVDDNHQLVTTHYWLDLVQ